MSSTDDNITMTYDEKKQENITNMITKYNVGTLQMFIKPEVLSMTSKERKKIDSIYYKRAYSVTNNEIIKSQKEYEKELEIQNKPKEPIRQQVDQVGQVNENIAPALPVPPAPALPPPAQALALPKQAPMPIVARGGAGFDSFGDFDSYNPRDRDRTKGYGTGVATGIGADRGLGTTSSSSYSKNENGILIRVSPDAEPFIASLIKFNNSGFPNNTTVTGMVDTFFNINLFRSFLKKLGEPIKLYNLNNNVVTDMSFLSPTKPGTQTGDKNKIFDIPPTLKNTKPATPPPVPSDELNNSITNWYPAQQAPKTVIGSVYAFIYTQPSDLELKQQSDSGNQRSTPSMLMIKEGDNYRLIGGKIDKVRTIQPGFPNLGQNTNFDSYPMRSQTSVGSSDDTSESTVERQITENYKKITAQSSLPVSISNTTRRFVYTPKSAQSSHDVPIQNAKAVIYSRQVTNSQIESIIESSKASSTDLVKVPINKLYYIVKNISPGILQVNIELDEHTKNILRLLFQILEKQNLLSLIAGQKKKSTSEFDTNREDILAEQLSVSSRKELESTIQHNIQFILDILFSKKMAFKYKGVDYIIDYLEWNKKFQRLTKVLENYKVAYYIDFNLFLEKLEKGKLPTDRDGTLFSSCAVRGAQLNNYWKKNFLDRNWTNFGKQLLDSVQVKPKLSITDIIPGFIKKALNVGSTDVMSSLNAGVNQISLVQYCFMGQEELIEEFKNIDNSFAGVEWKNENSWNKRKERLFAAMDNCGSDIYCFQNVQCSLDAYNTIVESLFPSAGGEEDNENNEDKAILEDISTTKTQGKRIEKYKSVLKQLLEKVDDPLNLIAQIYQRYNGEYEFVYYFEQTYEYSITTTMVPMSKEIALGNLTMFKKSKFELINEIDIRIAPFIKTHETPIKDIPNIDQIYQNSSFATVIYCRFKEGTQVPPSLPGQRQMKGQGQGQIVATGSIPVKKDKFPGFINGHDIASMNDSDLAGLATIPENDEDVDDIEEEEEEREDVNVSVGGTGTTDMSGGGDEDGSEWYNRDKSEETGFLRLFGKKDDKKQPKDKQSGTPCNKYTSIDYSPKGQIFGIINIKLETATTVQEIIKNDPNIIKKKLEAEAKAAPAAAAKATTPEEKAEKAKAKKKAAEELALLIVMQSKETKELIEVLLVAAFISNFRTIYYLTNSTDTNPYFMVGDFNFSIPSDPQNATRGDLTGLYAAPALALLLSRSKPIYNFNSSGTEGVIDKYSSIKKYKTEILKFIQELKIITYIHGGEGKNGRFRLFKILASKFSLKDPDSATTSGLIFTTTKITLCSTEDMAKITRDGRQEGLPLFPNKVNPSNSEAIGGVFALDTVGVKGVVEIVDKKIEEAKKEEKKAIEEADKQSIIAPLRLVSGQPDGLMDVVKPPVGVKPSRASPVGASPVRASPGTSPVVKPPVGASPGTPPGTPPAEPTPTPNVTETPIEPHVIEITGTNLTSLHKQTYTSSNKDIIKDLPSILTICQTGKPMYDYLTTKEMSTWGNTDTGIYSDHAPIMYNINNPSTGSGTCGPEVSTSTPVSSGGGGMEGGAAPENIKLITWNVGTFGSSFTPTGSSKIVYSHKFNGKQTETKEQYYRRISNNSTAIYNMMKDNDYQYMLLQEGPSSTLFKVLNTKLQEIREAFTKKINLHGEYTVIRSDTSDEDKYSEFYLVVKNKTVGISPSIISWGMMSVGPTSYYSTRDANTFFDRIIAQVVAKKIDNYTGTDIRKDCARLWFFIDTENEQVLVSVHLSFPNDKKKTKYMHQRQEQVYILLNTIVSYFRNSSVSDPTVPYKDYNIIFSGDFNINMLQPIPTDVTDRDFFECNDVVGQKTFIYTSKHNAPSSFGGENEGKYNPTNIDFALVYPKPVAGGVSTKTLTSTSPSPSPSTQCTLDTSKGEITNISRECQKEIFKNVSSTPPSLDKMVSAIGTDYSTFYASKNYMPPGSATLLDISDTPLKNVDISGNPNIKFTNTRAINYMIQASPGKSGVGDYITAETLSNSVMNSLILATLNGVKNIIIPFIGGDIFYNTLVAHLKTKGITHDKNNHCKLLIKGVEDYYTYIKKYNIKDTIEKIYFSPYGLDEENGLNTAIDDFQKKTKILKVSLHKKPGNMISRAIYDNSIDAIVNAANIELGFGTGISGMCFAAIGRSIAKQKELDATRTLFIQCFNKYIQNVKTTTVSPSSLKPILKLPTPVLSTECSHDMCKEYNRKIKLEKQKVGGCHAVMLFKTKDNNKYWSLLGKEGDGMHQYMMNLIGGKIDHPYKSNTEYVCIIDNMIKEIKEESKIDLQNENNFNNIFKKDSTTTNTSVNDYNVIKNEIDKKGDKFTNYIFYGIMGEYKTEEDLKQAIIPYNNQVKTAYKNPSIDMSLREMMYLNLIDFNYDPYTENDGKYKHDSGFTPAKPPKEQKFLFTIPEIQTLPVLLKIPFKWENDKDYISFYAAGFFKKNSNILFDDLTKKHESRGPPTISKEKRATIDNFIYMQEKGMPGMPGMSNFKTAIGEINKGHKESHWMWYIIPSNFTPTTNEAIFFKIDTTHDDKGSLTAEQYLDNESLRNNYIEIIVAIYKKYEAEFLKLTDSKDEVTNNDRIQIIKTIIGPGPDEVDYNKLINSIGIFYPLLKTKYTVVDGVSKITEFVDVLKELDSNLKLPTSSTSLTPGKAPAAAPSKAPVTSTPPYQFYSVPIKNPLVYCYQAAAFQLLFSIDSIRNHASKYEANEKNISGNALMVLKQMDTNIKTHGHPAVEKKNNQDSLAVTAIHGGIIDTQQDSQEFLINILNSLIGEKSIKDEITFWEAKYSFCDNTPDYLENLNMNMDVNVNDFEKKLVKSGNIFTSYNERKNLMNIPQEHYKRFGKLIGVSGISETVILGCPSNNSNINSTIQQILDSDPDMVDIKPGDSYRPTIGNIEAGTPNCIIMRQKEFIKIPDSLKYICFYKALLPTPNTEYTFAKCKDLTINGIKFILRGYISHSGTVKFDEGGQQKADSGHYVYVGIENNRQVLYNDSSQPQYLADNISEYITKGYVFLYKRVTDVLSPSGGGNTIASTLNPINKSTVKATSNKKPNKRTRKHVNKITHKLKDTINTNTNKTKNKKKTRKHIHKNRVIAQ